MSIFPSIFWMMVQCCGSILGAIPSALLTKNNSTYGFASIKEHTVNRLTLPSSSTSTNPSYISFCFDTLTNITLNREHSSIIINRGMIADTKSAGFKARSKNDTLLHDSIDSKQTVRNLCASQSYFQWHFYCRSYQQRLLDILAKPSTCMAFLKIKKNLKKKW